VQPRAAHRVVDAVGPLVREPGAQTGSLIIRPVARSAQHAARLPYPARPLRALAPTPIIA
jgi:hypothetical protein